MHEVILLVFHNCHLIAVGGIQQYDDHIGYIMDIVELVVLITHDSLF